MSIVHSKIKNPFKFGTIVDEPYFTNRTAEISNIKSILNSENHVILISPRRFGKTSLVQKVITNINRSSIYLDLQLVTSVEDFAAQLLRKLFKIYTLVKIKEQIKSFRILPNISINPLNNEIDISFQPTKSSAILLEDVLNLIEKVSTKKKKLIVVLDEFQEIKNIGNDLDRQLRSTIQHHQKINYVFLGSQEHLMRDIFENKNSPFYHFGNLLLLGKIPYSEFLKYLTAGFVSVTSLSENISKDILSITKSHPFYTQQLAFSVFEFLLKNEEPANVVPQAVEDIIRIHDMDFERLWNTLNRTDMKVLIGMTQSDKSPLSSNFSTTSNIGSSSTIFSSLKRLANRGILIKTEIGYEIDDPFFSKWIKLRRLN